MERGFLINHGKQTGDGVARPEDRQGVRLPLDLVAALDDLIDACEKGAPITEIAKICARSSHDIVDAVRIIEAHGVPAVHYYDAPTVRHDVDIEPWVHYQTPLRAAISGAHFEIVKYLVKVQKVDVSKGRTDSGSLPHNYAASLGNLEILRYLIEDGGLSVLSGSTPKWKEENEQGQGPDSFVLRSACMSGKIGVVRYVLEHGNNVNIPDPSNGATPLECACSAGNLEIVEYLIQEGGLIKECVRTCECCLGWTPLHEAAACGIEGSARIVDWLVRNRHCLCSVRCAGKDDTTPLEMAFETDNLKPSQVLLAHGATCDLKTPFHAIPTWVKLVKHLRQYPHGWTQLQLCVDFQLPSIAEWLLHRGDSDPHDVPIGSNSVAVMAASSLSGFDGSPRCQKTAKLIREASRPWKPITHHLFGPKFRERIFLLILIARATSLQQNRTLQLPFELWLRIGAFLQRAAYDTRAKHIHAEPPFNRNLNELID
eukprot:m.183747 g.183747  ORF g.183747 m.183747 type:complete len:485 (+) comp32166_c0_seq1:269-1723(+)